MIVLRILSVVFIMLGLALLARAFAAPRRDFIRYLRGSVGALGIGLGNLLLLRAPMMGLLLLFIGVWLVITAAQR